MSNVKTALTRKFGPLPAWAWLGIFGVLVYYFRSRISGGGQSVGTTDTGTGTGSVGPAAATPQAPVTLQPGESVYDPNTGGLLSTPGGGSSTGGGGGFDMGQAIEDLANSLKNGGADNGTLTIDGGGTGSGSSPSSPRGKGASKVAKAVHHSLRFRGPGKYVGPKGAKLNFNPRKAGIKAQGHSANYSGTGTYRKVKTKAAHTVPKPVKPKTGAKTVARSAAHTASSGHDVKPAAARRPGLSRNVKPAAPVAHAAAAPSGGTMIARPRPKIGAATTVVRQRPVTTHPKPSAKAAPRPAPRPSAPPPRKATRARKK